MQNHVVVYENLYKAFSEYCLKIDEPIHLCGLSLGGILALQFAIENPLKVRSLTLIGTQFVMPKKLLKIQNVIFKFMPHKAFSEMGFGKKDFMQLSNSMMDLNFEHSIKKINCDVLILCGEKDKANKAASLKMKQYIHNAQIQLIENAGHEVNADAAEKLSDILNIFYKI